MRILMISDVYFPRVNGVSTSIMTFRKQLQAMGHEVILIAPEYPGHEEQDPGIWRVPSRYLMVDPEDRMMIRSEIRSLEGRLRESGIDVIHIQTPFVAHYAGIALARKMGVPVVESYHTFFEEYLYNYIPFLPRGWLKFAARRFSVSQCRQVDEVVVPSHEMLRVLREYGVTAQASIIPTGIDLADFVHAKRHDYRAARGIAEGMPLMGFVGRVAHEKNIGFLLQVLLKVREALPDTRLVIAGEGPARAALHRQAQALGLADAVIWENYLPRDGLLQDCYRAADVFVFASRTETQGLVVLEAMSLGVPVVSTAVMGTKDVLVDGQGVLIAQEDVDDFASRVVDVLSDPQKAQQLSQAALDYAALWGEEVMAQRMAGLYQQLMDARSGVVA